MSVITLTSGNFKTEALDSDKTVLIDFWAPWCGPCRMLSPVVDEVAGELQGKVKVCKVNVDEQPELASKFNVMSIPTLVVLRDGKVARTSMGLKPKQAVLDLLR